MSNDVGKPVSVRLRPNWLAWIVMIAGCSGDDPSLVPITGRVTLNEQGIADLIVTFTPIGTTPGSGSLGATDRDGRFTLTDVRGGAGGHVGDYRVSVYPAPSPELRDLPADVVSSGNIGVPPVFLNPNKSPLRATVPAVGADFQITLTTSGAGVAVVATPIDSADNRQSR